MKDIDFFISYSSDDEKIVGEIVSYIESMGVKCWYASRDSVGRYAKAIVEAIGRAKIFLLCLSKKSAVSEHVLNEIEMAYNKKRTADDALLIEPLCIEPIDIDSPEFDEIMYYIRRINFISPSNSLSAKDIAKEVLKKNKGYLKTEEKTKQERTESLYFSSERENVRLQLQHRRAD